MKWLKTRDPRRSLSTRLILLNLVILLLALGALVLWTGMRLQKSIIEESEHELELKALIVANGLQEPLQNQLDYEEEQEASDSENQEGGESDHPSLAPFGSRDLQTILVAYAKDSEARLTILDPNLQVRFSSDAVVPGRMEKTHPEIIAALQGNEQHDIRWDEWSGQQRLFVAAPIYLKNNAVHVAQLSIPMSRIQIKIRQSWATLVIAALAVAFLSVIASVILARELTRPVRDLTRAANQVADGDFSIQLDSERPDELGALARAFNHMADEINSRLQRERAFISHASHELRSPITAIQLRAELLDRTYLRNEERFYRYLRDIRTETTHLSHLLEQLLDLNRLQSRPKPASLKSVPPGPSLARVVEAMRPIAEDAGLRFSADLPDNLPPVRVIAEDMELIVRNLVDNAIKYTPAGGMVRLTAAPSDDMLRITVTDSGIGIPAADLPHVFDRFYRGDEARNRKGSGLGLAMVKTLLEDIGGEIEISSQEGKGTTVSILLPL